MVSHDLLQEDLLDLLRVLTVAGPELLDGGYLVPVESLVHLGDQQDLLVDLLGLLLVQVLLPRQDLVETVDLLRLVDVSDVLL